VRSTAIRADIPTVQSVALLDNITAAEQQRTDHDSSLPAAFADHETVAYLEPNFRSWPRSRRRTPQLTYIGDYVSFLDLQLAAVDPLRTFASAYPNDRCSGHSRPSMQV